MFLVVTIHGISGTDLFHRPFLAKLRREGYIAESFAYNSTGCTLTEASEQLDDFIDRFMLENDAVDENFKVILVGHSAGGRVSLLCRHPNIIGAVILASPVQGSFLASWLSYLTPINWYFGPMFGELGKPHQHSVPFPFITISTSLLFGFDGRLWCSEMTHSDACEHLHIDYSLHSGLQMMDERIQNAILSSIGRLKERQ